MEEAGSHDAVVKALQMLKRVRRLEGTVLIHEGVLFSSDTLLNEKQVLNFTIEVNALVSQYRNGSRPLARALLGFDGGNVMIFNVRPYTLCLLFSRIEEAGSIEQAGEEFLLKWADSLHLEVGAGITLPPLDPGQIGNGTVVDSGGVVSESPSPEVQEAIAKPPFAPLLASEAVAWPVFRQKIENLLSKVLGRAQASKLIDRELATMGLSGDLHPGPSQFRPFGMRLVQKVKDKAVRRLLEVELVNLAEKHVGGSSI